ncbi:MAG: tRNA dihydrouridine synthase DusB, partial [Ruthenibacterium sp.]
MIANGASLAPMAGVTDKTMRHLCAAHGAVCTVSEMVSAKALTMGDKKSPQLMAGGGGNVPYGIQLFGADAQTMGEATAMTAGGKYRVPFDFIDINMGCPAPKITGGGAGSALLKNPILAGEIAKNVVQNAQNFPVSVKMRIGWDEDTLTGIEVAKRCENAGVAILTIHGRTRAEMYVPGIHTEAIAAIKAAVSIPVVANGDVLSAEDAVKLLADTGCDGVAVGRGAMGNPWLFAEIAAVLHGMPAPEKPSLQERFRILRKHIYDMCEDKGEFVAMQQARTHAAWYMHGLHGAAQLRRECCSMLHFTDIDEIIAQAVDLQRE